MVSRINVPRTKFWLCDAEEALRYMQIVLEINKLWGSSTRNCICIVYKCNAEDNSKIGAVDLYTKYKASMC
jgi:hypothetical protein